ncbi:MAG TPA: hypothetical protein VHT96_06230 [Clostridia bacterium]|nr:hypothetical protein [Clostridia bacterium]
MDFNYTYAELDKEKMNILDKISKLENEISQAEGKDIVLIAYSKKD